MAASLEGIGRDIETIAGFSSHGPGTNRLSFTPEYRAAVDYVAGQLAAIGYEKRVTSHGNTRFRRRTVDWGLPAVVVGSHLDSVPNGGRFDGVAGVVAAVEVARLLEETQLELATPYEVAIFAEEEGARFGAVLTGSKAMVGQLSHDQLAKMEDSSGIGYFEALGSVPTSGVSGTDVLKRGDITAYFELHIEQSVVLETSQITIGIVEAITGQKQYMVTFSGTANHAGATPMGLRRDSLTAAAEVIRLVETAAAASRTGSTVATVGLLVNDPNGVNVIPGRTTFSLDIRDTDPGGLERTSNTILSDLERVAGQRGIEHGVRLLMESTPVALAPRLRLSLLESARELGIDCLEMPSGAGHDAQEIARIADVGMVFVPSIEGRSHCPEEDTSLGSIALGVDVLLSAVKQAAS